ncbi:hypothetical protein [Streptomyces sp. NPDC001068]|uniref:hypothetical protein n=1 Tax=Streptomyces sp. NPDC001068 TaxID=3364544 RepID=UPI0036C51DC2
MKARFRRWRLAAVVILTAVSVLLFSSSAYAGQVGESSQWAKEGVSAGSDMTEARDPAGNAVEVWRGADNFNIYIRVNGFAPVALSNAQTHVTPQVIYANGNFIIFHTGVEGNVYYTFMELRWPSTGGVVYVTSGWIQVPNGVRTTDARSVSATTTPDGMYLAFRSATNNDLYGAFFNGVTGQWESPSRISVAESESSPAVAYSSRNRRLVLAYRSLDNRVFVRYAAYGGNAWSDSAVLVGGETGDPYTYAQPALAMGTDGTGQVAMRVGDSDQILLNTITDTGVGQGWTWDIGGFIAWFAPTLVRYAAGYYLIATADDGSVWWKKSRS